LRPNLLRLLGNERTSTFRRADYTTIVELAKLRRRGKIDGVDEGRKRTLAVVTAVLLVPRLGNLAWDGRSSAASCESFLMSALGLAERIMDVIDRKYPKP